MSFFEKEDNSSLQYDDSAFTYYLAALALLSCLAIILDITIKLLGCRTPYWNLLRAKGILKQQITNSSRRRYRVFRSRFFYLEIFIFSASLICFVVISTQTEGKPLQVFDPYAILGVPRTATLKEIKKAFRLMALKLHPDRTKRQENKKLFVKLTQAYHCFSNDRNKENCEKYGNPEGLQRKRRSIALPSWMVQGTSQYYALFCMLVFLLVVIPRIFLSWHSRVTDFSSIGLRPEDELSLHAEITNNFTIHSVSNCLARLNDIREFFKMGSPPNQQPKSPSSELAQKLNYPSVAQIIFSLQKYKGPPHNILEIAEKIHLNLQRILLFSLIYAKKEKKGLRLPGQKDIAVPYLSARVSKQIIKFMRAFYHQKMISLSKYESVSEQLAFNLDMEMPTIEARRLSSLLQTPADVNQLVKSEGIADKMNFLIKLSNLPTLTLQLRISLLGVEQPTISTSDTAQISFKITKLQPNFPYCLLENYPFLKYQRFYFFLTNDNNLIHFEEVMFGNNLVYQGKLAYRQSAVRENKFKGEVLSDCFEGIDVESQLVFRVEEASENEGTPEMHPIDAKLKYYKSTMEEFLEMLDPDEYALSDSDQQN